jgi:hypothetical protein
MPQRAYAAISNCMTVSTDWPRRGPAKDRETSGSEGRSRDEDAPVKAPIEGLHWSADSPETNS